jgi:hypothetical protein
MTFVGSLIKNTSLKPYQNKYRGVERHSEQIKTLEGLLNKGKKTSFGKIYNFENIIQEGKNNLFETYRKNVPIYTYEQFYREFLKYQIAGSKQVIWKNDTNYYALTSGTTEGGSKRIPVSDQMIKQFQKTTLQQLVSLHELDLPSSFFKTSVLVIGGSTQLDKQKNHNEGDLSGILQKNKLLIHRLYSKPGKAISDLKTWEDKLEAIIKAAPKWDVGVITGSPVWVTKVLESVIDRYKVNSIHDIWPNFKLFLHGGVYLSTYKETINKLCRKSIMYLDTYLTSEGYFAYQKSPEDDGMFLLTNHGVYYEFVEEKYFDQLRKNESLDSVPTLTTNEVEVNKEYALIISTSAGLWRYCIGDVVKFNSLNPPLIKIIGRLKHTLNMVGEHISLENMNRAILRTNIFFSINTPEFCVSARSKTRCHDWYIGSNQLVNDMNKYAKVLDQNLMQLNDD